jgi:hypothetical protein
MKSYIGSPSLASREILRTCCAGASFRHGHKPVLDPGAVDEALDHGAGDRVIFGDELVAVIQELDGPDARPDTWNSRPSVS